MAALEHSLSVKSIPRNPSGQLLAQDRRNPLIIDENAEIKLDYFYIPLHYQDTISSILIPHGMIVDRVEKLAYDILQDYHGQTIHLLCVLKGEYS